MLTVNNTQRNVIILVCHLTLYNRVFLGWVYLSASSPGWFMLDSKTLGFSSLKIKVLQGADARFLGEARAPHTPYRRVRQQIRTYIHIYNP